MSTPLGTFVRTKRDSIPPESVGLGGRGRRRAPGLRRSELASRAGISVEYLTRIEQGRDRNPSPEVVNTLADALSLDITEREHLRYLAKITGGACAARPQPTPARRDVRSSVLETLRLLEPGVALVTNRLGDILAYTSGFELVMSGVGLLEAEEANLTRYVFTDPRAPEFFADWNQVADEQAFDLWLGPSVETSEWFKAELAPVAGQEFTRRLGNHVPPQHAPLRLNHPTGRQLRWNRETLELPKTDAQEIVVFLPADESTAQAMRELQQPAGALRAVT